MSTPKTAPSRPPLTAGRRWALLATVGSGLLLIALDNSILYTALPTLTAELHATGSTALWIINAYPVVMAGLLLGSGTLGDRVGHRRMFLIGLALFGAASLGAAFSPSAELLIAARAVLAVGAAAMMPATLALIRITFEVERERNLAIAVWGSIAVVGAALGPIVGGVLVERFHWGSVFLINVPVVLAAIVATVRIAPTDAPDRTKHWDAISSAQALLALVGAVFFIKELAHIPPNWPVVVAAALASALGATLFVRRQRRLDDPPLDFAVFRNAAFASGVVAAAATMFAIGGAQLVTTQRYQLVAGFTPLEAGLLVSTVAVGSLPTALLGGALLHRIGLRVLIAGGLAVAALGTLLVLVAMHLDGLWLLVVALLVMGAGLGATMSVASTAIVTNVSAKRAGMASSVEEVSYEFGSLTAVALLGSLLTLVYSTTVQLPDGAPSSAGDSLPDAIAAAGGDAAVLAAAGSAYDTAFTVAMVVLAVVLVAGAAVTGRALREHGPGSATSSGH